MNQPFLDSGRWWRERMDRASLECAESIEAAGRGYEDVVRRVLTRDSDADPVSAPATGPSPGSDVHRPASWEEDEYRTASFLTPAQHDRTVRPVTGQDRSDGQNGQEDPHQAETRSWLV
ncbi:MULTISPECIES: hypothetical protein [Nocardiaceae]|uniref:hypothetical protein n=1 Tax=Nocardiaceae TaxID=85025 RepID=UPI001E41676C|nr:MULTISPECIES: hypothetical protein [Rhodococcus]